MQYSWLHILSQNGHSFLTKNDPLKFQSGDLYQLVDNSIDIHARSYRSKNNGVIFI